VIIQNASTCFFIAGLSLQHSRALDEFGEGSKNKKGYKQVRDWNRGGEDEITHHCEILGMSFD